jgi:hypothetical protein
MLSSYDIRTDAMPSEMQSLLGLYPRDTWDGHPGFRDKTRQWLRAHDGFRHLAASVRKDTEALLEKAMDIEDYASRLAYRGNILIRNLHGHHTWEDRNYFPELSAADPRFDRGLEILEKDHADLDVVLEDFTQVANRTIKLLQLDETVARDEAGALHGTAETIEAFLARHLTDEEELAVPIILHHRLRG